jgi:streptogramin lyase
MTIHARFAPGYGQGITVAPGAASASSVIGRGSKTICLTNIGSSLIFVRTSDGPSTAAATDYPIPAGMQMRISKPQDQDTVSYISPGGAGSLHIIPGEGF